jgi:hypothetical protein
MMFEEMKLKEKYTNRNSKISKAKVFYIIKFVQIVMHPTSQIYFINNSIVLWVNESVTAHYYLNLFMIYLYQQQQLNAKITWY